jgi:hypothetical protein
MSFGLLKFDKMATKFKMASETCIFLILLSKLQFATDFKKKLPKTKLPKKIFKDGGYF